MARPKAFDRKTALQQATRIFWSKGYAGTSISHLTRGMGLSRSSLYASFGGKQALFLESLAGYIEAVDQRRTQSLSASPFTKENLRQYFQGVIAFTMRADLPGGCFFTNTAIALPGSSQRVLALINRSAFRQEQDLFQCLEKGKKTGEIAPTKNTRQLARFFVSLLRGISVLARIKKDPKDLNALVSIALQTLE
jgi:TetR/AcrR family transcriptional repressor of nem operon